MIEKIEHWKKQYDAGDVSFVAEMLAQFEQINKQVMEDEASVFEQLNRNSAAFPFKIYLI